MGSGGSSIETAMRTVLAVLLLPPCLAAYSAYGILLALSGSSAERLHRVYMGFARLCLRVAGTRLEVHGRDHIEPGQAYVVVANHESAWDPPCLVAGLPEVILRFVAKRPLMRIPIFGWALRLTGNVMVVRAQTQADVERIRGGMDRRSPDVSMLFFAEGTRSRDGKLHPFKMGAFAAALIHGLPVLPVGIAGTRDVWPKGTLRIRSGPVTIEVGTPIPTQGLRFDDRAALRHETWEAVAKLRERASQRLRRLSAATRSELPQSEETSG